MLADAWKAVSAGTISNCFQQAGLTLSSEPDSAAEEPDNETEELDLPLCATSSSADVTNDLLGCGKPISDTVTFEDFGNVDSAVSSCAELNDDDIIEQVLQPPNRDSKFDDGDVTMCSGGVPCRPVSSSRCSFAIVQRAYHTGRDTGGLGCT
ncbi:hypothetical protein HPB51_016292 [Rhipicephalus microplus]|uniref:Uncharacterized protein n=1 Tax=Rhipicephalus microplus TaxID=6941 RepID=A0A9J6DB30_RHIMP|nr:hypothetical protein HPB51_016292 [Rhipicephalus microplus]